MVRERYFQLKRLINFFCFSLALVLAGCQAPPNAFLEAAKSNDPALNSKVKFFLLVAPMLSRQQKEVVTAVAHVLRESGFALVEEDQADYIIDVQFTASLRQETVIRSPGGGDSAYVNSTWGYLRFLAYRKADVRPGRINPIWAAQIAADSKILLGNEGLLSVQLFRHLGEAIKMAIPLEEKLKHSSESAPSAVH